MKIENEQLKTVERNNGKALRRAFTGNVRSSRFVGVLATILVLGTLASMNIPAAFADTAGPNAASLKTPPNQFVNPNNAFVSDNLYAKGTNNFLQGYKDFGFNLPLGSTVTDITVTIEANRDGCGRASRQYEVSLSNDGGTTFGSTLLTPNLSSTDMAYNLSGGLWGLSWTPAQVNDIVVLLKSLCTGPSVLSGSGPLNLDLLTVTVDFSPPVLPEAGLSITKSDSQDPTFAGNEFTYTLTVTNTGPNDAVDVIVSDPLPAGVTLVSVSSSQGGCVALPCNLGTIVNGASATVTITVTVDLETVGTITNTATVTSDSEDLDLSNNSVSEDTLVNPPAPVVDLSIMKSDTPDPAFATNQLTYTITVTNNGEVDVANVIVTDILPLGVTFVNAVTAQGACSEADGTVTCNIGTLSGGASAIITITVTINPETIGTITNTSVVTGDNNDPVPANNSFSEDTEVQAAENAGNGSSGGSSGAKNDFRSRFFAFGDPESARYDDEPPTIGQVSTRSGSLKVFAMINDNVGVKDALILVGKATYPMQRHDGNPLWWTGVIPTSDLPGGMVFFKVIARDYNNNIGEYAGSAEVPFGGSSVSTEGAAFVVTPLSADSLVNPAYSITVSEVNPGAEDINPQITIKNTSTEQLQNVRLMLSPELKGKFLLSEYAIKSIAPESEATISLILNGKPNVNEMGQPIPYQGQVIISIDNRSPYVLELNGDIPNESALLQSIFMKMISSKAEQRYKSFEKPDMRISEAEYEVTLGSGESVITSASDELIIRNNGDKALKNLRIMTSSLSNHFLLEQNNIEVLPAGSFVKVKLISNLKDEIVRDLAGELLVVPENGAPITVPINIGKTVQEDKNEMYEVRTLSGSDTISHTADGIVIANKSEETIDNVRIILPRELSRVFSLSEDSFQSIEPNSEKTVYLQQRGTIDSSVKQILNDYTGDIIIVSSDGMKKIVPVNAVWKDVSSEHFVIYARDSPEELKKAMQVINFLEHNYDETAEMIGESRTKMVIYMTSSLDELKTLGQALAPSTYVYGEDVGFVWSNSEDVNLLALREFTYRTVMNNYATYWTKENISSDKGNWLVDGLADYVTARIAGERGMIKSNLDAFTAEPVSFEWYGAATPAQRGAAYTVFKNLVEEYGDGIIDKILSNLGSEKKGDSKICSDFEQCVLLRAVYDMKGLNMDDKRNSMTFAKIANTWNEYLVGTYDVSALN